MATAALQAGSVVGFTTNGTCSVDCITDGASMTYVDSYGKRLDDWEGNTLT